MWPLPDTDLIFAYDIAARAGPVLRHRRPPAPRAAGRRAPGGVDHRQRRGVVDRAADAADRAPPSARAAAPSRLAELGLARVRDAGWVLAFCRSPEELRHQGHACHQRLGLQELPP